MKKLIGIVMVMAILASVMGLGVAQGAVAPSQTVEQPKVMALALPFAFVDAAFPVLVIVKNQDDSTMDEPQICIAVDEKCCTIVLPEDDPCQEPWSGISGNGYAFGFWFVECSVEQDQTITATVWGNIGGVDVTASDSVEITLYD
jgi:hypothetical protein